MCVQLCVCVFACLLCHIRSTLYGQDLDAEASQILESREQKKLSEGGDVAGIGRFQTGALERNKTLQMFTSTVSPANPPSQMGGRARAGSLVERRNRELMISDKKWGSWEKHTSGFGSRMLNKMGYIPGMGLGKKGEGIVNPVKAFKVKELGKASESMVGAGIECPLLAW